MTTQLTPAWVDGGHVDHGTRTAVEIILDHAARTPTAPAVRQWDERLDYATLVATASRLALTLREHGVGPETLVGVCLRRRPSMVVGVLGVLLAGGAYVPIDPDAPLPRRAAMTTAAGLRVVVTDADTTPLVAAATPHATTVAVPAAERGAGAAPRSVAGLDNAAYVLHTSGSTGRPKGVVVTHRSLVAHVLAFGAATGVDERTVGFGFTNLVFDVSVHDLFVPLVAGGSIALLGEQDRADHERMRRFAVEHGVTWGFVPPAVLPLLDPAALPDWRLVYTGAEAAGPEQVARWTAGGRRFVNAYGPTEATVCVTSVELTGHWDRPLPIGRPLPNHRLVVVSGTGEPLGQGEPGELLIGGVGLARGYLGDAALTAQRFVPDPFGAGPGQRLYRTGDRAEWLPDGTLRFLGRVDRQLKIRGQRVEPGELEAVLRGHPGVRHAVVEAVAGRLVAFCEPSAATVTADELTAHAARLLPSVLVPAEVLLLPSLPLTPSGKVDTAHLRTLLPADDLDLDREGDGGPAGVGGVTDGSAGVAEQRALARLWASVLGRPARRVRPTDDFVAEGGHSVAAMRLVAAVRSRLRRDVSAEDVFTGRTLAGFAARVAAAAPLSGGGPTTGNPPTLSPSQRRLWFLDKLAPDSAAYNVAFAERLRGPLDVPALRAALTAVATRHEVLRWRVPDSGGVPMPVCDPPAEVPLPVLETTEDELVPRLAHDAATRLDLATGPVWRVTLYRLGPHEHVLSVVAHHAVADGWSQAVLYRDLAAAYTACHERPAALPVGYGDYAVWRAEADARDGERDLAWWTAHLEGAPTVLDLPRDRERPAVQTYAGSLVSAVFTPELDSAVRRLAAGVGATPSAVLLAGLGELLRRLTGRDDAVIGAVVADRRLAETENLVGFFVDIVPLRLRSDTGRGFADAARRCLAELLEATAHPAAPLDRVVSALGVRRDPTRSPLVQVLFNVFNFAEPSLRLPGCTGTPVRVPMPGSPFDLTVYLVERDGRFAVDVVHNPDLYDDARIEAMLADYLALLAACASAPDVPLGEVAPRLTSPPGLVGDAGPTGEAGGSAQAGPVVARGVPTPVTPTERRVARVWCEVLGRPEVRAIDNFFDVGGTSMALVKVQAGLTGVLGREPAVVDLFRYPTVRAFAEYVDGAAGQADDALARAAHRAAARRARPRRSRPAGTPVTHETD
jgi:mycobactin peptide synthetase MbtE